MKWSRWLLGVGFLVAGVAHFLRPDGYVEMVPSYLPAARELVYLSGVAEIAGGVGLLIPRLRRASGWALILLLVLVFPANVNMALYPERYDVAEPLLWARLPFQAVLIWWVHRAAGLSAEQRRDRQVAERGED
ncbi:MAG: DoxX family protein [Sporichthyaceae bacterium]